ncbi:MAG: hypothetical protein JW746_02140 [Candidatus Krumholzibacteriota bacterium]|nr:hypothetical protein [Candidatus Krumholzibacteriota bacterium]
MTRRDYFIVAACMAVMVILSLPLTGSMTDDTYIHMQYARNLADAGELSFNRGDPTYGATSPLWVFLLSIVYRLGGDMAHWSRILSLFFGVASAYMVYRLALGIGMGRYLSALAAAIFSSEAWVIRWSSVGMESSFAVFIVIAVIISSLGATRSSARSLLFGSLLFLAYLVRPEALLLFPLAVISFMIFRGSAGLLRRFRWLFVYLPAMAVWLIMIKGHTGTWFPLTAGAKQGNIDLSAIILTRAVVPARIITATVGLPLAVLVLFLLFGIFCNRKLLFIDDERKRPGIFLSLIWIFALPAAYLLIDFQIISRYLIPVSPFIIVLGTASAAVFFEHYLRRSSKIILSLFAALVMIQNVIFLNIVVVEPTKAFSDGLQKVLVKMGIYLSENSDRDDLVAAPDIGAIGYYSGRRILDLGGLVSPEINKMRSAVDYETLIDRGDYLIFGADYFLDRSTEPMRFSGRVIKGIAFTPVMSGTVSNLGIRQPSEVTYVLYRLDNISDGAGP